VARGRDVRMGKGRHSKSPLELCCTCEIGGRGIECLAVPTSNHKSIIDQ